MIRFTLRRVADDPQIILLHYINQINAGLVALTLAAAQDAKAGLIEATPLGKTGGAREGWMAGSGWIGLGPVGLTAAARVWNDVAHVKFLIEGTGQKRVDGIINPSWKGMHPNALLRSAWLAAPGRIAEFMTANAPAYLAGG